MLVGKCFVPRGNRILWREIRREFEDWTWGDALRRPGMDVRLEGTKSMVDSAKNGDPGILGFQCHTVYEDGVLRVYFKEAITGKRAVYIIEAQEGAFEKSGVNPCGDMGTEH